MTKVFKKSFTQQEAIPEAGISCAVEILRGGRLHRYNVVENEISETALLEQEYAAYQGTKYCLACASGGYAMHIALKAAGMEAGESVITNAFTLAPVPGAIDNAGGKVVLVEIDENYCVDLAHLESVMISSKSRFFMMSHMRGHIADMDAVVTLCDKYHVTLIEDCAHTMGGSWNGKKSGSFGKVACFSTQTYKHMNSGEGGLLTSDDPELMARAIIMSGSYMMYERHLAAPAPEVFKDIKLDTPNYSGRMDNLRAALLRTQLPSLDENCRRWNDRYYAAEKALAVSPLIILPMRPKSEVFVGSSIQFRVKAIARAKIPEFIERCDQHGVVLKWFGGREPKGFTSRYDSWRYIEDVAELPKTLEVLSNTFDLRIPLTFDLDDMKLIANIIIGVLDDIA